MANPTNKADPADLRLFAMKLAVPCIPVVLGCFLFSIGALQDDVHHSFFVAACVIAFLPMAVVAGTKSRRVAVARILLIVLAACSAWGVIGAAQVSRQERTQREKEQRERQLSKQLEAGRLEREQNEERQRKEEQKSYSRLINMYEIDPIAVYDPGWSGYESLIQRANSELKLAWNAEDSGHLEESRKHLQRAADYKLAADFYRKTKSFPPGFDADLATK